jgi:DNA-binding LacI/PurR family transcriptional regulator
MLNSARAYGAILVMVLRGDEMKSKRPTQMDVAQRAGVSRGTVSLVLNQIEGRVPISQETQKRVLAAAKSLGYSPNPVAQMLARGNTRIIGIFPFDSTFPYAPTDFYYPYLVGIEREAAVQDYNILLFTRRRGETPHKLYQDGINSLRLADGLILTGNYPDSATLRWLIDEEYPFVLIGRSGLANDEIDSVVNNHTPSSYEATRHLLNLNHHRLGLVVDNLNLAYHQERLTGCQRAVDEIAGAQLIILGSRDMSNPVDFITTLRQHQITALICADRALITPTVDLIQKIPLQIPGDMSLLFLVSNSWDLPFANPTRVNLNRDIKGKVAIQRLIERLEGKLSGYQQIQVSCHFAVGDTTALC